MAYTKQTWTDDVSAVTGARMTHIEDGIYANSTNIDTINNNVNPSGTATTTQTDFTEGQLTQKLGLKYIKMKGQTSQASDPTPTNPVDVNSVSGNNVIKVCNKNLFNPSDVIRAVYTGAVGTTGNLSAYNNCFTTWITMQNNATYVFSGDLSNVNSNVVRVFVTNVKPAVGTSVTRVTNMTNGSTYTNSSNYKYLVLEFYDIATYENWQLEKGSTATSFIAHREDDYEINLGTIELCKIGNYQDYIYKNNGKWYKYKTLQKVTLTGTETWSTSGSGKWWYTTVAGLSKTANSNVKSNCFKMGSWSNGTDSNTANVMCLGNGSTALIGITTASFTTIDDMKTYMGNNEVYAICQLETPTIEEITYEPLIAQLNKLDKIGLYDISNISQDNGDMKMLLDFTICNDNYNGLREFIRA